jgi:hypothetical protein
VGTVEVEVSDSAPVEVVREGPADDAPLRCGNTEGLPARALPSAHGAEATAMMLA